MTTMMAYIYSSHLKGVGIAAGGPFFCAEAGLDNETITKRCKVDPNAFNVKESEHFINNAAENKLIDPLKNLKDISVIISHGILDSVVNPGFADKNFDLFK